MPGFDGWGRPIVSSGAQAQAAQQPPMPLAREVAPTMPQNTRDMPMTASGSGSSSRGRIPTLTGGTGTNSTGRPEQYVYKGWRSYYT
jgi:hypothetical protein